MMNLSLTTEHAGSSSRPVCGRIRLLAQWNDNHHLSLAQEAGLQLTCISHDAFNLILKQMTLHDTAALAQVCRSAVAKIAACLSGWIDHHAGQLSMKLTILAIHKQWIHSGEHYENVRKRLAALGYPLRLRYPLRLQPHV